MKFDYNKRKTLMTQEFYYKKLRGKFYCFLAFITRKLKSNNFKFKLIFLSENILRIKKKVL